MHIMVAPHPPSLEHPDAWAYHAIAEIARTVSWETWGVADTARRAVDVHVIASRQAYAKKVRLIAVDDAGAVPVVLGHVQLVLPTSANTHLAVASELEVAPEARRQGVGRALLKECVDRARAAGRSTMLISVDFGEEDPQVTEWLTAASGQGRVRADHPGVRLTASAGFECAIVERQSVLDFPPDAEVLERFLADGRAAAGDTYRVHTWDNEIPEEWIEGYAALETALAEDEPRGDQDVETDPWDAERVRSGMLQFGERGEDFVITAVEHVPTGELAGMTMLKYPRDPAAEHAEQESTVVLRAHRGHRLGMLVKAVNAAALLDRKPGVRRVWTWNNEENPHMLAINVAMGFRPAGGCVEMQLKLG